MLNSSELVEEAKKVLELNDAGKYTIPSHKLYPHQWLWDSCFIAIGISNYDVDRSQTEILSLFRGQWENGMLPHIIFENNNTKKYKDIWRSWLSPFSPDDVATSGITQPPLVAEAVVKIGAKLSSTERRSWYRKVLPGLVKYHSWLYSDRDPHGEGLIVLIHPWETGLDNTPPWMAELHSHVMPTWTRVVEKTHLTYIIEKFRRDTKNVPVDERPTTEEMLGLYSVARRIRRKAYDTKRILPHGMFAIEDLTYNSIFIRANKHLVDIAKTLDHRLPEELLTSMEKTESALEQLWDEDSKQYYSRNFVTHDLIKEPSIASLMPLYSGAISKERAKVLVKSLENKHLYGPTYPVPTVPINSPWFYDRNYWQGATWVNMNWLLIDGLERSGFKNHSEALTEATIELVDKSGMHEYFSPINGSPAGTDNFSWTAALIIDLIERKT